MDASLARAPNTQLYARQKAAAMAANARRVQRRLDRGDDGFGNVVLDREHVGKLAIVALSPDLAAVAELGRDADAVGS